MPRTNDSKTARTIVRLCFYPLLLLVGRIHLLIEQAFARPGANADEQEWVPDCAQFDREAAVRLSGRFLFLALSHRDSRAYRTHKFADYGIAFLLSKCTQAICLRRASVLITGVEDIATSAIQYELSERPVGEIQHIP